MGRKTDGEEELGLLALGTLQSRATAGTEAPNGLYFGGAALRHQALRQRSVQVAAGRLLRRTLGDTTVALAQGPVQPLAPDPVASC